MTQYKFNGKEVWHPKQPAPKKNQIWRDERGNLCKVLSVQRNGYKEVVFANCMKEDGSIFGMGIAWFNGIEYSYVGYVF